MTLALMAVERYIFICHGVHYLRLVDNHNIYMSISVTWLLSGAMNAYAGLVLSQMKFDSQQPTIGLVCEAFSLKEHLPFPKGGPASVWAPVCNNISLHAGHLLLLSRCVSGCTQGEHNLEVQHHQARCTIGLYFLLLLLQLSSIIFLIIFTMTVKKEALCSVTTSMVVPLIIIIPSCINPQISYFLFSASSQRRIIGQKILQQLLYCVQSYLLFVSFVELVC